VKHYDFGVGAQNLEAGSKLFEHLTRDRWYPPNAPEELTSTGGCRFMKDTILCIGEDGQRSPPFLAWLDKVIAACHEIRLSRESNADPNENQDSNPDAEVEITTDWIEGALEQLLRNENEGGMFSSLVLGAHFAMRNDVAYNEFMSQEDAVVALFDYLMVGKYDSPLSLDGMFLCLVGTDGHVDGALGWDPCRKHFAELVRKDAIVEGKEPMSMEFCGDEVMGSHGSYWIHDEEDDCYDITVVLPRAVRKSYIHVNFEPNQLLVQVMGNPRLSLKPTELVDVKESHWWVVHTIAETAIRIMLIKKEMG